jgi:hypothetical protein
MTWQRGAPINRNESSIGRIGEKKLRFALGGVLFNRATTAESEFRLLVPPRRRQ